MEIDPNRVWPTGLTLAESEELHRHVIEGTRIFGFIAALAHLLLEPAQRAQCVGGIRACRGGAEFVVENFQRQGAGVARVNGGFGPPLNANRALRELGIILFLARLMSLDDSVIEAAKIEGANWWQRLWHIILPRISNSILVAISFTVLGLFSAFTLPYVLGPAAPEMMGPFMQRTFRDLNDPVMAITQAVIAFGFCIVFGLFYVRSVAKNRAP